MQKDERTAFGAAIADIRRAIALLSRLPVHANFESADTSRAVWAYPIVGAIVSALGVFLALGLVALGAPALSAALCGLAAQTIMTGAMHEDGLADTADGFWGGWTPERRLAIMKDSHIGSYGVIALIIAFGMRASLWGGLLIALPAALCASAILSRAAMPLVMHALPHARTNGLSQTTGRPARQFALAAIGSAIFLTLWIVPVGMAIFGGALVVLFAMLIGLIAHRKIGGQTGDVLGATQVLTELGLLMAFVCLI